MRWLLDTNVVLRILNPALPGHEQAAEAVARLLQSGEEPCVTAQNLIELWVVATRPLAANGLGLAPEVVRQHHDELLRRFTFLTDTTTVFGHWRTLVQAHRIVGKRAHDTRLVAVMLAHGVNHLLTFNTDDFTGFTAITAVSPATPERLVAR